MTDIFISISNIVTAFRPIDVIGSKVTDRYNFIATLKEAVAKHDFSKDRVPGQGFIDLGTSVNDYVSAGVGRREGSSPGDYVVNMHRGRCSAYLHRSCAEPTDGCACVVYTLDAYLKDPEVDITEHARLVAEKATHVLVAVLAFAGPQSPLSPYRFVSNLAGGNREAQVWTADEIRAKAKEILDYDNEWVAVADPPT